MKLSKISIGENNDYVIEYYAEKLKNKAFESVSEKNILDKIFEFNYEKELNFKEKLFELLKNCKGVTAYEHQHLEEDIKSGINNMFETIINNKPYTSAPADQNKRKDFYKKISNGYSCLADLITEQFTKGNIDSKQVYSCLEVIGTGGKACAGRWKQVLEEMINSFDNSVKQGLNIESKKIDKLDELLKNMFTKARHIAGNKLAESFVNNNSEYSQPHHKLHYIKFFQKHLNFSHNFKLQIMSEDDSYISRQIPILSVQAEKFLKNKNLDELVFSKFESIFKDELKENIDLYNEIVEFGKKEFKKDNTATDIVDYLSEEIFEGFEKKIREQFLSKILKEKDFSSRNYTRVRVSENDINKFLKKCIQEKHFDFFVDIIEFLENNNNKVALSNALDLDNKDDNTPLIWAILNNQKEVALKLIDKGANLDIKNIYGYAPLILAIGNNQKEVTLKLIDKGANLDFKYSYGDTALIFAIGNNQKEVALKLIDQGANLDFKNSDGDTVLNWAIHCNQKEVALKLIDKCANLDFKDSYGDTALILAICNNQKEVALKLIDKGTNLDFNNKNGDTALILAIRSNEKDVALKLIDKGANLDFKNRFGDTLLILTILNNQKEVALKLIDKCANLDIKNSVGDTLLTSAIRYNQKDVALKLIDKGANLHFKNSNGQTPLTLAICNNQKDVALKLIDKGANLNFKNRDGDTLLTLAIRRNEKEVALKLIDKDTNFKIANKYGKKALIWAISKGEISCALKLIEENKKTGRVNSENRNSPNYRSINVRNGRNINIPRVQQIEM